MRIAKVIKCIIANSFWRLTIAVTILFTKLRIPTNAVTTLTVFPITAEERVSDSYCSIIVLREVTGRMRSTMLCRNSIRYCLRHLRRIAPDISKQV